jgi:type III secretion protein L
MADSTRQPVLKPLGRILRASDVAAWHRGNDFMSAARNEADRIVAEAMAESERLIEEGRKRGESAAADAITRHLAERTRAADDLLARAEDWLAELVVDTVERILDDRDPRENTRRAAVSAIRAFRHARALTVRVPPDEVDALESGLIRTLEPALRALVVIRPDPDLASGRCIVSCEFGAVETSIAAQVAALRDGLARPAGAEAGDA